jgi:hypothetical protein
MERAFSFWKPEEALNERLCEDQNALSWLDSKSANAHASAADTRFFSFVPMSETPGYSEHP